MSKKRKKRRRTRTRPSAAVAAPEVVEEAEVETADEPEAEATAAPRPGMRGAPSPFSPFGVSMVRGLRAVGGQPTILATAFVSLLVTWVLFAAIGSILQPGLMGAAMSVPPMHLFLTDLGAALSVGGSSLEGLAIVIGIFLLRAFTFGLLIALLAQALQDGRTDLRAAVVSLPKAAVRLAALLVVEATALLFANQIAAAFLADLSILLLGAALYFLVFVPIVGVVEDAPPRVALRRGLRAARLPGTRHVSMVLGYFFIAVYAVLVSPFGPTSPATPGVAAWTYALGATFLHVSVLGAFTYRWLEVRDQVPSDPARRRR